MFFPSVFPGDRGRFYGAPADTSPPTDRCDSEGCHGLFAPVMCSICERNLCNPCAVYADVRGIVGPVCNRYANCGRPDGRSFEIRPPLSLEKVQWAHLSRSGAVFRARSAGPFFVDIYQMQNLGYPSTLRCSVWLTTSICCLKLRIADLTGVPASYFHVFLRKEATTPGDTLGDLGVTKGDSFTVSRSALQERELIHSSDHGRNSVEFDRRLFDVAWVNGLTSETVYKAAARYFRQRGFLYSLTLSIDAEIIRPTFDGECFQFCIRPFEGVEEEALRDECLHGLEGSKSYQGQPEGGD
jgi:hypothetical protein